MTTPLVDFYAGTGTDSRGRTLAEIHQWSFAQLEYVHDYIQWVFPLRERSAFRPDAPTLTEEEIAIFRASPDLHERLRASLDLMLGFYGFERRHSEVVRSSQWAERSRDWVVPNDHNHLRLTRIMKSLATLGLEDEARALQRALVDLYESSAGAIPLDTVTYWRSAVDE